MKKYIKILSLVLCCLIFCAMLPANAEAAIKIISISTSGFTVADFDGDTTYYLCYPSDFSGIKITSIQTNIPSDYTISVERYCDCDYPVSYTKNQTLNLGYGRARITVTVTSNANAANTKSYMFVLTDPHQESYRYRFLAGTTKVYSTTSTSSTLVATLQKGTTASTMPLCVATSGSWTKIVIPSGYSKYHGKIGWVKTADLVEEYPVTNVPYDYKVLIDTLKKSHPNWTFEYRYMGTSLPDYVNVVSSQTISNTAGGGTGKSQITYYMDPINFLNEQNIFMFLDLTKYNASAFTSSGVGGVWTSKSGAVCTKAEATQYILNAGQSLRMNTYFITSRAAIESGYGTSNLAKGKAGSDGKLYYNFYGIGAYDNDPANGGTYAQKRGWDTPYRSIVEGANWINDQYVQRGQNTAYFFRFYPYRKTHIYMSDLSAPKTESGLLYKAYKAAGKLSSSLHFVIPVYDMPYPDVSESAWYYEDVYRATDYQLFEGMADGSFKPENNLTRAELVTVLARISGADISKSAVSNFKDVRTKDWFYRAVSWAYVNGVVKGISNTSFAPNKAISRQELCTMLVRFAENYKIQMKSAKLTFKDTNQIAAWAKNGVAKCVGETFVNGMPGNVFCPKDSATRAQASKILSLFYEQYFFFGV